MRGHPALGLLLLLVLGIMFGVNCDFGEESQMLKGRVTLADTVDQDNFEEQQNERQPFSRQVSRYPASFQNVWVPPQPPPKPQQQSLPEDSQYSSVAEPVLTPPIGGYMKAMHPKRKKECGFPVLRRRLLGPVMKRSSSNKHYFANSEDEVRAKMKEEDDRTVTTLFRGKRAEDNSVDVSESHSGGCIAKRQWIDMGGDYYPRYVKSYHCSSSACDGAFHSIGECKPRHYTTKVLKRITPQDTTSVEDCDQTLPEALRVDWKLISVTVTTCCDCMSVAGRIFNLK